MQRRRILVAGSIFAGSIMMTVGTAVTVWAAGAENGGPGPVSGTQINNTAAASPSTSPSNMAMNNNNNNNMNNNNMNKAAGTAMMPGMPMTGVNPEG